MKKIFLILALLPLAGCVTTGRFKAQEAEALSQKKRAEELESALKSAGEAAQKTEQELRAQAAALQKSNKELQESLEAKKGELSKKVAELIRERDGLIQRNDEKEAELADLRKKLADAEAAKAAELAQVKKSYDELTAGLKSEIAAGEIQITELKGKLTVNLVDRILFDSGQAEVKRDGRKVLEKVGQLLNNVQDKNIRIEGHTDNKPISGDLKARYPSNWELSTARATAVARHLQEHAGVDARRLVAAGYGEYRPVAPNDTAESRALNRRIEIILVPRE